MAQGPGSTRQNNGPFTVGGFYNFAPFTLTDGQACSLQFDVNGNLKVTSIGGGGGSNPAAGPTGAPVPADADYLGINISGTLFGVTGFNLPDSIPIAVAIVNANGDQITSFGGGTQYVDGTAESIGAFTGTVAFGYNGTDVVGLRMDASDNLLVNLNTPIPAGTNLIGQIEVFDGTNVVFTSAHAGYVQFPSAQAVTLASTTITGTVSVTQGTSPWVVAGAQTPADSYANPTDAQDVFALLGGWDAANAKWQRVQVDTGTGTLKVDIGSNGIVAVTGTVGVTQGTTPWVVAGNLTHNNAAPAATEVGVLAGLANAARPTYTEGGQVLLSTDLSGALRVNGPYQIGQAFTTYPGFAQPVYGNLVLGVNSGVPRAFQVSGGGALAIFPDGSQSQIVWNSATAVGSAQLIFAYSSLNELASGAVVSVDTASNSDPVSGGTFIIETADASQDAWVPVTALIVGTQQLVSWPYTPITNGVVQFAISLSGLTNVRARLVTAIGSGKIILNSQIVTIGESLTPVVVAGTVSSQMVGSVGGGLSQSVSVDALGLLQESDRSGLADIMQSMLQEIRAMKFAIIEMANSKKLDPRDFVASNFEDNTLFE